MNDAVGVLLFIGAAIVLFACGCGAGGGITHQFVDESWREIIANKGCAEFYLDEKHQRQWRWK